MRNQAVTALLVVGIFLGTWDTGFTEEPPHAPGPSGELAGWDMINHDGRDYIAGGSIQKFYRFHSLERDKETVWFRSPALVVKAMVGSQEVLINNIKFILSDPVVELSGALLFSRLDLCKLIDPVLRPSFITSGTSFDTVILDPGDSDLAGEDFALEIVKAAKTELEKRGLKVVLTREANGPSSISDRLALANKVPNSIFIGVQYYNGTTVERGAETLTLDPEDAGSEHDSENIALATAVHASLVRHLKLEDRGVRRSQREDLKGLHCPGTVFLAGNLKNPDDAKVITAAKFRAELATTIGQAVGNYKRALQPRVSRSAAGAGPSLPNGTAAPAGATAAPVPGAPPVTLPK